MRNRFYQKDSKERRSGGAAGGSLAAKENGTH